MGDLLRIVADAGLFFVSCTVLFLIGFVLDSWMQARRLVRLGAPAADTDTAHRTVRSGGAEGESLKPARAAV